MSERFDVLVTGEGGGHTLPKEGLKAVLRWLAASGFVEPYAESVARTWVAVYSRPGATAHTAFIEGQAPKEAVFEEACLWTGPPEPLPYGTGKASFWLEFRGCLYDLVPGDFRKQLSELVHMRLRVVARPHVPGVGHREVPEDERPPAEEKAPPVGAVGTRVEEF